MKDVLIFQAGIQIFIIDGSRRTDSAARAVIEAAWQVGRIHIELADRAKEDRKTLDDIKKRLIHCTMETRTTTTGDRWTFYTKSGVFMDIPSNSRNYIRADKDGLLYSNQDAQNAPTAEEPEQNKEITTEEENEPQRTTETAQKTADKTTDMETFRKAYSAAYSHLYDHCGEPETDEKERYYCGLFCDQFEEIMQTVRKFSEYRHDLVTSDIECAAFMIALEAVGTPQASHEQTEQEETSISTTEGNGDARTERPDRPPRMPQDARKAHHPTKYPPTTTKDHTGQNTKQRQAARDGRKATENTRKMAFWGSDVNDRQKSTVQKHPPPFVKRFRQRFETLISDRFLRSGVRG